MRKMREVDGYITLEASLLIPLICFLLVLLCSFFFYIMNLGITSGMVKEAGLCSVDGDREGVLSADLEKKIMMGKISSVTISDSEEKRSITAQAEVKVPVLGSVDLFGLHLFRIREQQKFMLPKEADKIRRWSLIE
ncbi:hypothetical protein [Anaerostipes sp.]|uniref:hypothetical protein n=1 Tax=Anaerostipes sp. TaxID=1872530 RepID=UPI0025C4CB3D|nr:hypothetical protein [Anaerostipes sp.]MBS7008955.1 hypothetical protein [Anaerostipes sp.]